MMSHAPDDGALVDRIMTIGDTPDLRRQVLADNPARPCRTDREQDAMRRKP